MYAIINDRGKQYKVSQGDVLWVDRLDAEPGADVSFDNVVLVQDGKDVRVGTPHLDGVSVSAKVVGEMKGKKIDVIKYKRRKRYRRKQGHRQRYTEVEVTGIK